MDEWRDDVKEGTIRRTTSSSPSRSALPPQMDSDHPGPSRHRAVVGVPLLVRMVIGKDHEGYDPKQPGHPPQPGGYPQNPPPYQEAAPVGGPIMSPPIGQPQYPSQPLGHPSNVYNGVYNEEDTFAGQDNFGFSSQTIRHAFIRKVYGILVCQLLVTMGFIMLFLYHIPTKEYVQANQYIMHLSYLAAFIVLIALSCCESIRRKYPTNFICLGIYTLFTSIGIGTIASYCDSEEVLMAVGVTAAVCFSLSIFAFQTKWDFTLLRGFMLVILIVFLMFIILCIIFPSKALILLCYSIGIVIFCLFLVYDTQLMIGGKHKYALSPEEYVFGALNLYLDILNLFSYILQLIRH